MALAMNGTGERAFLEARDILRKGGALTREECQKLEHLFDEVSGTQFIALTQDPAHYRALRDFDRHLRRPALPVIVIMAFLLALSVAVGIFIRLQH
ncbi:hypothetical protein [Novosphingobium subterraneum]|jgi:hypothetical protein|uniref:Uncharacterized protein n=1 Tax=Novosphingobium subterraneum TaxID=48936 RepID=A0A0B8Z9K2_9SPHN|nr:hypothetical protein [Novosphingobium subterraneum]KHS42915.1 hypothetical protein NJ75_03936 [Novosphingobium subterraneum]